MGNEIGVGYVSLTTFEKLRKRAILIKPLVLSSIGAKGVLSLEESGRNINLK